MSIEAGLDIQTPFKQAVAEDMVRGRSVMNMTGPFNLIVPLRQIAYLYAIGGDSKVTIIDEDGGNTFETIGNSKFAFPIKLFQETRLSIETSENTLTQLLIIDEY
jgi:hypothetical protein